jgi:hypothetical protein
MDMQQQLQQQTRNLFGSFPFPNFGAPAGKPAPDSDKGGGSENKS